MAAAGVVLGSPRLLAAFQRLAGRAGWLRGLAGRLPVGRAWSRGRELPWPARRSFRAWWRDEHRRPS
jgi:L-lactate dehydrogenase complex protein LldF